MALNGTELTVNGMTAYEWEQICHQQSSSRHALARDIVNHQAS